jgi:hypothetical protein
MTERPRVSAQAKHKVRFYRTAIKVRHYMTQPLVELYGGCMVVLKVS